jgi:hypothetical protein
MTCPDQVGVSPTEREDTLMSVNLASGSLVALVGVVAIAVPVSTLNDSKCDQRAKSLSISQFASLRVYLIRFSIPRAEASRLGPLPQSSSDCESYR